MNGRAVVTWLFIFALAGGGVYGISTGMLPGADSTDVGQPDTTDAASGDPASGDPPSGHPPLKNQSKPSIPVDTPPGDEGSPTNLTKVEFATHRLVNDERASENRGVVELNESISLLARYHAANLAENNRFNHTSIRSSLVAVKGELTRFNPAA